MLFGPRSWTWEAGVGDFLSRYVFGAQTDITNCYSIIDMLLVQKISIYFFSWAGFVSQGNEFSYYMMICSSFILNQ